MRLATDRIRTDIKPVFSRTSPRLAVIRLTHRTGQLRHVPLGSMVLDAFGALGIAASSGLASGVLSLCRLGAPSPDFSACGVPGSPGFHPPWGVPLPSLGLTAAALGLATASDNSACCACLTAEAACARPPLAFREAPFRAPYLCFKFQRAGK